MSVSTLESPFPEGLDPIALYLPPIYYASSEDYQKSPESQAFAVPVRQFHRQQLLHLPLMRFGIGLLQL